MGLLLLAAALLLPGSAGAPIRPAFPVEWPLLALALCLARDAVFAPLRAAVGLAAAVLVFLKLADIGTGIAFGRVFNPLLDLSILRSGWHLLSGTIGRAEAFATVALALIAWAAAVAALVWGLGGIRLLARRQRRGLAAGCGLALAAGLAALAIGGAPVTAGALPYLAERGRLIAASVADLAAFERSLGEDPLALAPPRDFLGALRGKDVMVLFVESYGRSALDDPLFAGATRARLSEAERKLDAAGIGAASGWLRSPTVGGQSWLAHGALLSGLWTDSQSRYDRMIASRRPTLNALFREAGWRTVAVMPAITMDWPEAGYFGYDAVFAAGDLGYRGRPFDWVTMPDQFTLEAVRRIVEAGRPRRAMVEAALISSHAPWTPIPRMVPWSEVGDGRVFDAQAAGGESPRSLWRDPARVRAAYGRSLGYALEAVTDYAATFGRGTVFVILGDHQPAPLVTGPGASRDVPVHILSDDPAVLRRLDGWRWTPGMVPGRDVAPFGMDAFRERFVRTMSD